MSQWNVDPIQLAYRSLLVATNSIVLVGLVALGVVTARNASLKHHSGVARGGFLWYKIALWLTVLFYLLSLAASSAQLHRYLVRGYWTTMLSVHINRLLWFAGWIDTVVLAVLMSCIARLIVGTKMAVQQQGAKGYRIFIDVFAGLIIVLGFAAMVMQQVLYSASRSGFAVENDVMTFSALQVAAVGLLIIGGLANTIFSWIQRSATRKEATGAYKSVGTFISAIATINFVLFVWSFVGNIIFNIVVAPIQDPVGWFFTEVFVTRIATVAVLWLIYKLGAKEEGGLWLSTEPHGSGVPKSSNEISVTQV
ncbi:hypothetical protein B0T16DRAFT_135009 [Cercophora newfieldiana]|uniref:Uncharacterized protein n=1 Tax=Cercophora newfieldiana TaxID=92897 RepID=A0AA40CUD4_9PEZI|nr:hypothetical protein B0T16DRAFT_135009 [Cercophora newfieldiana]